MSAIKLPHMIDPVKFAEQRDCLEGYLSIKDMPRLYELCYKKGNNLGEVKVFLEGGIDQQGIRYLQGYVEGSVPLECQRCLQQMIFNIHADIALSPVYNDEEAEQLPSSYNALYLTDAEVALRDIVEDELLLAIPIAPKHENVNCDHGEIIKKIKDIKKEVDNLSELQENEKANPFAKLAELKSKKER